MSKATLAQDYSDKQIAQEHVSWLKEDWFLTLGLILAVILTYTPVWWAGYIWDDDFHLTANPCIVGPLGLKQIWTTSAADVCPLTLTTFWLEHVLWGLRPLPYHLLNVLLHGACAVALWQVLRDLNVPGAWWGAALWALHPVGVESVVWITETKNTESGLFFLLSILAFQKWLRDRNLHDSVRGNWHYLLTLLFAALAMTSKSSTVILPLVLCMCVWWIESKFPWRIIPRLLPIFFMSLSIGVITILTVKTQGRIPVQTLPERLVIAGDAVWFYLGKLLYPHQLSAMYPRWHINVAHWASYLPSLAVLAVLIILWLDRKSWSRPWFFTFTLFLIGLLPVLGFINHTILQYSFVFNHFQYLASMAPLALGGAGMAVFIDSMNPGNRWLRRSLCIAMLLTLGIISWQRAWVYNNEEALLTDTLKKNPNCSMAHFCLGHALYQNGQVADAINQYQEALKIDPTDLDSYRNLGLVFADQGRPDEAIAQFSKALKIDPQDSKAHHGLGTVFAGQGRLDDAIAQFSISLKINPNDAKVRYDLGTVLAGQGRLDDAIAQLSKALELNPDFAEAQNNLGSILLYQGRLDEAMVHIQAALRLNPDDPNAQKNFARALTLTQQKEHANK